MKCTVVNQEYHSSYRGPPIFSSSVPLNWKVFYNFATNTSVAYNAQNGVYFFSPLVYLIFNEYLPKIRNVSDFLILYQIYI